jgi:hypothetical protein
MTEDELQHMKQTLHDVCGVLLRLQIDLQAKDDLRDKFARAALEGLTCQMFIPDCETLAKRCYEYADAMMEARK